MDGLNCRRNFFTTHWNGKRQGGVETTVVGGCVQVGLRTGGPGLAPAPLPLTGPRWRRPHQDRCIALRGVKQPAKSRCAKRSSSEASSRRRCRGRWRRRRRAEGRRRCIPGRRRIARRRCIARRRRIPGRRRIAGRRRIHRRTRRRHVVRRRVRPIREASSAPGPPWMPPRRARNWRTAAQRQHWDEHSDETRNARVHENPHPKSSSNLRSSSRPN